MGDRDSQYFDMNAGAHRRPPPQIAAPAMTWQRGYWRPPVPPGKTLTGDLQDAYAGWYEAIDNTLAHLFRNLCLKGGGDYVCPNHARDSDTLYLFSHRVVGVSQTSFELEPLSPESRSVRHDIFMFRMPYQGASLVVSARRHLEYFVILFALDLSESQDTDDRSAAMRTLQSAFDRLHDRIITRYKTLAKPDGEPFDPTSADDRREAEIDSHQLVTSFQAIVNDAVNSAMATRRNDRPRGLSLYDGQFSDFLGIIYGLKPEGSELQPINHPPSGKTLRATANVGTVSFDEVHALKTLDAAWPVIGAAGRSPGDEAMYGEPEYTVATFNHGSTLYVSALGRLAPELDAAQAGPMIYTLIVSYPSRWRLGRFIDRLNAMGTLRLAALRDLKSLNAASNQINRAAAALTIYATSAHHDKEASIVRDGLRQLERGFEYGLKHRVERSRYYVHSYKDMFRTLSAQPVKGFQFYGDFIRSRVFDAFEYIERIGARYDDLLREANHRFALAQQEELRRIQKLNMNNSRHASLLLEAAEILSIIPLTYYGGQIFAGVAPAMGADSHASKAPYYLVALALSIGLAALSHWLRAGRLFTLRRWRKAVKESVKRPDKREDQ